MIADPTSSLLAGLPLIAMFATMPLFARVRRGQPLDPDVARRPTSLLLGYFVRNWMVWLLAPVEQLLVRLRVSPTAINVAAVALGVVSGVAFATGWLQVGGWLVALGGICDILDGRLARARGMSSAHGAFLDSTLDRFAEAATFTGLAWYFAGAPWSVVATVAALGGSMLVSYARARGEALGVASKGGLAQRAERLVVLAFGGLLDPVAAEFLGWPPGRLLAAAVTLIAVAALFTAVRRTTVIARTLAQQPNDRAVRSGERES